MCSIISRQQLKIKYSWERVDLQVWVHKYNTQTTRWHAHARCHINCYIKLLLRNWSTFRTYYLAYLQSKIQLKGQHLQFEFKRDYKSMYNLWRLLIRASNIPELAHWFRLFRKDIFFVHLFVLIIFYPMWWSGRICQLREI